MVPPPVTWKPVPKGNSTVGWMAGSLGIGTNSSLVSLPPKMLLANFDVNFLALYSKDNFLAIRAAKRDLAIAGYWQILTQRLKVGAGMHI